MGKRLPAEVQKQIDKMTEAFRQKLTELFEWSNDEDADRPPTAVEIEDKIREWIRHMERAYYNHSACHCGWVPMDERLDIGASELSPRVLEMLSYLGAFMPFGKAQAFLAKYCLPTYEVTTPPKRLYVSADGINYLLPSGESKEIKVAAVYETEEPHNKKGEIEIHAVDIEYVVATDPEVLARAA